MRYLSIFIVAGIICPMPDPVSMCIYAMPLLGLYLIGIGVAWWVHPSHRKARRGRTIRMGLAQHKRLLSCRVPAVPRGMCGKYNREMRLFQIAASFSAATLFDPQAQPHFNGAKASNTRANS